MSPAKPFSQTELVLDCAAPVGVFCSNHGQPCVSLRVGEEGQVVWPLHSTRFRDWLVNRFYQEHQRPPAERAFRAALRILAARAQFDSGPVQSVGRRVSAPASGEPSITLDLHNDAGETVEISALGWRIAAAGDSAFRRGADTLSLPRPVLRPAGPSALESLRRLLNLENRRDLLRCVAWLLTALRPGGPYPILVLTGPPGSGKSTAARILRSILDPSMAPFSPLPLCGGDLLDSAWNNWMLAFDHVPASAASLISGLCRLSTGSGFRLRDRPGESLQLNLQRPVVLTAAHGLAASSQLAERAAVVELPPISETSRRPENALLAEFSKIHAEVLGELCSAASAALGRVDFVRLPETPRFADMAQWAVAAAPALGLEEHQMLAALLPLPNPAAREDAITDAICTLMLEQPSWTGTATQLLATLASRGVPGLPRTPKGLVQHLNKRIRALRSAGLRIELSRPSGARRQLTMTHHAS